ncbi:MAG: family 10 glycosylhydrolase [Candidatus Omnitrophica bacterium]|nr:family 10 glycosylhydrolase [Candidatus Omnitrophota bacterium]
MKRIFSIVIFLCSLLYAEKFTSIEWEPIYIYKEEAVKGYIQSNVKYSDQYSYLIESVDKYAKYFISSFEYIPVNPGEIYEISGYVKSDNAKESGVRMYVYTYNKDWGKISEKAGIYCGGTHDWQKFSKQITIDEGVSYIKPVFCMYESTGTAYFDEIKIVKVGEEEKNLVRDGGFEQVIKLYPDGWRIPVKLLKKGINGIVEITDLSVNEHLIHYTGDEIQGLTMNCKYNVLKPANCYLSSDGGSQYWHLLNYKKLKNSFVFSNERIDLGKQGENECKVVFTRREKNYMDRIHKGVNCIRGHHYFAIKNYEDEFLGITVSLDAISSPEKAALGSLISTSNFSKNCIFTIANLDNYSIDIIDFKSNWKEKGWFTFKIELTDGDSEKYEIIRADVEASDNILKERLSVSPVFDEDDIPLGYWKGLFGNTIPDVLKIKVNVKTHSPKGYEIKEIVKEFKKGTGYYEKESSISKKVVEPKKEGRGIVVHPYIAYDKNPEIGKRQIKEFITKIKEAKFNMVFPFAWLPRTEAMYNTENKYFIKIYPDWDPLKELIEEAHKENIEVHAIVCLIPEGDEELKGILKEHPEWALGLGKRGWLDPVIPEIKEYRINNILEIVRNYDIDGIHLDYGRLGVFQPSIKGAEIYKKEFGIDPSNLEIGSEEYKKWFIWTGNHLTDLVGNLSREIKKIKPNVELSAYVQGDKYSEEARFWEYHQNFPEWINKGYIDFIVPTAYVYDALRFKSWVRRQIDVSKKANPNIPVYPCLGIHSSHGSLDAKGTIKQIKTLRELSADGFVIYTWEALKYFVDDVKKECLTQDTVIPKKNIK